VRHRILVLSFSPIARDARVMRHVRALAEVGDVITCGFGPTPRALPTALDAAAGAPVWADMHEWGPQERSHDWRWHLLVGPLATRLRRTYLPRAAAVTTVSEPIAAMHRSSFGVECSVVRNAASFVDLSPSPVDGYRLRLVHSGGAVPGRDLESLLEATIRLPDRFTLDLYLVPGGEGGRHLRQLRAAAVGHDRVCFHDPVAPDSIPPTNVNTANALPSKFFDFVRARLALAVGPTPEMAR
jgi:hypothetical protein